MLSKYICKTCGKPFSPWRNNQLCCSNACASVQRLGNPDKFWSHVDKSNGPNSCWEWKGAIHKLTRYGRVRYRGKLMYAHRLAYELTHHTLPDNLAVLHSCDNPSCVNPAHLSLGTAGDNMADRDAKGRTAKGERSGKAKLTLAQVQEIRRRYVPRKVSCRQLAEEFGVRSQHIYSIIRNKTWRE